jgi:hypothetical protein
MAHTSRVLGGWFEAFSATRNRSTKPIWKTFGSETAIDVRCWDVLKIRGPRLPVADLICYSSLVGCTSTSPACLVYALIHSVLTISVATYDASIFSACHWLRGILYIQKGLSYSANVFEAF